MYTTKELETLLADAPVRGHVGPTPKQLDLGAILLRVDRVDFIEVTTSP
jgi:hypothetical protein